MELFINYVLPNVMLFGGLYGVAKLAELAMQEYINYVTGDE